MYTLHPIFQQSGRWNVDGGALSQRQLDDWVPTPSCTTVAHPHGTHLAAPGYLIQQLQDMYAEKPIRVVLWDILDFDDV